MTKCLANPHDLPLGRVGQSLYLGFNICVEQLNYIYIQSYSCRLPLLKVAEMRVKLGKFGVGANQYAFLIKAEAIGDGVNVSN